MAKNKQMYTPEGYKKLTEELGYLKFTKREEVKEAIAVARSFGDLSENAEYDEARNEQAKTEARIKELEELIENAVVIDEANIDLSVVSLGSTVTVFNVEEESQYEYSLVGSNEVSPLDGKISDQSPVGKALIGHREGDIVEVIVPSGDAYHLKLVNVLRKNQG